MTNKKPEWREIFSGKTNILAFVIALAINVYVFDAISDVLLVYLVRFMPTALGKLLLLLPTMLLTILVYYVIAKLTRRFFN